MKNSLWSRGSFAQSISKEEMQEKEKTIHKKHDEDMNYSCKECNKKVSAHNKDWHDRMCDECFNNKYFPEHAVIIETDIDKIKKILEREKKDNLAFWKWLKSGNLDLECFNKIVKEVTEQIDCTKCGNCCKDISPVLSQEDIQKISEKLKSSKEDFLKQYAKTDKDNNIIFNKLPCPFLKENKCAIYNIRPNDCRNFPNIDKDITRRCHQFFSNAEMCPIVFNILQNAKEEFLEDLYEFENLEV